MDLIEDDKLDVADKICALVEHASQDFRGHLRVSYVPTTRELTIKQLPSGLIWTSPVRIPIAEGSKVVLKSRNFWFESALMGDV